MIVNTEYIVRFRWVVCQLDALQGCLKPRQIRVALKSLPKTLDATYARVLANIPEEHSEDARRILQCLISAFYPLDLREVAEIVAINPSQGPIIDFDNRLCDPQDVLTICSSLVSVIPSTRDIFRHSNEEKQFPFKELRLAHYSVKEYLISNRVEGALAPMYSIDERLAHDAMAGFCIRYLLQFDQDDLGPGLPGSQYGLLESALFAPYAARCWSRHFRAAGPDLSSSSRIDALALTKDQRIIRNSLKLRKVWWDFLGCPSDESFLATDTINPLYYASLQGLTSVVSILLDLGENVHSLGPTGTALNVACHRGHADTVQMLLQAGANIELVAPPAISKRRGNGSSPLGSAVLGKHANVVELLLAEGADVYHAGLPSETLIGHAVINNDIAVARLLISAGADVNQCGREDIQTPLQIACNSGNEDMVDLVLNAGARMNVESVCWNNSLHSAICGGNVSIINKLENLGCYMDLRQKDDFVSNYLPQPIHRAQAKAKAKAKYLLSMNVFQDPEQRAFVRSSLLRVAVQRNFKDLVSMMLQIGTDVNLHNDAGITPLIIAARLDSINHLLFMRLLLQHGADVNRVAADNSSALHNAAASGNADAVILLLENDADVNGGSGYPTALTLATKIFEFLDVKTHINERVRYQDVIDTLLAHGAQDIPPPRKTRGFPTVQYSMELIPIVTSGMDGTGAVSTCNVKQQHPPMSVSKRSSLSHP